jgi:hypothetical protein
LLIFARSFLHGHLQLPLYDLHEMSRLAGCAGPTELGRCFRGASTRAAVFAAVAVLAALSATAAGAAAPAGSLFAFGSNYYGQLGSTTNN